MIELVIGSLATGWTTLCNYLAEHVITCLIPAFFIAGAIATLVRKDGVLKYFSPDAKKTVSYRVASVSGTILAVCSCTILPMFAGILKKGSGIGPAITFLYAGPAINILAVIYTAKVLGPDIGIARAASAIILSIIIGLVMALLFRDDDHGKGERKKDVHIPGEKMERPRWTIPVFFIFLVSILLVATSNLDMLIRLFIVYTLSMAISFLLIFYFSRDEVTEWGCEIWDLTKKIFPILLAGTFTLGMISYFLPPAFFTPFIGDNSLFSNFIASLLGAILYMPTLLEVPVIGTTFGYLSGNMAKGPALALLLTGPAISLPSLLVLLRIMNMKKTGVYAALVIVLSTLAGYVFGNSGL